MLDFGSLLFRRLSPARRAPNRPTRRLNLEHLEDRIAPAAHIGANNYATIQAAVNAATTGAVITIDPGTYAEMVTVNKSVTIEGAQQGVAGQAASRNNPANESIVTGSSGSTSFYITASNVTIDGFTIEDATDPKNLGFGIFIAAGVSGTHIQDNIIQNNIVGIGLANGSGGQAVIEDNLIQNNNQPGTASGTGIYSNQFIAGGPLQNVLIQDNVLRGNANAGIGINSTDPTKPASNLTISRNTFDANGRGVYLFSTSSSTISGNTIANSTAPTDGGSGAAIALYGDDSNLSITHNLLAGGAQFGILVGNYYNTAPDSGVVLYDNSIAGFAADGLHLNAGSYSGALNASGNFWGAATGPTGVNNPGGGGSRIEDPNQQVVFAPWLSSGANGVSGGQPGFLGNQGSLISSNPPPPPPPSPSALLPVLQQQIIHDLVLAQGFQGDQSGAAQQLNALFALVGLQAAPDVMALVLDEAALTAGAVLALEESAMGMQDAALLSSLDQLETGINVNPLTATLAGQQIIALTGALVVANM
ncbi:MAG TPA: right-handed parallel beta-helix repeat-containing protein [Gemmataceae bacterium]|jgi:parallel beta-helix repeat protein